jgi:hypothetical protein
MSDLDDDEIDVCTNCGAYYGWASVQDIVKAHPEWRPFPQRCRRCLVVDQEQAA